MEIVVFLKDTSYVLCWFSLRLVLSGKMCAGHFSVDVMKHHEQGNLQRGSFELMDPEG